MDFSWKLFCPTLLFPLLPLYIVRLRPREEKDLPEGSQRVRWQSWEQNLRGWVLGNPGKWTISDTVGFCEMQMDLWPPNYPFYSHFWDHACDT